MRLAEWNLVIGLLNCISALPMKENTSASNQSSKEFPKLEMMMDELLTKLSSVNEEAAVEIMHGIIQFINSVGRMTDIPLESANKQNNKLGNIKNIDMSPDNTIEGKVDKSNATDNKASNSLTTKIDATTNEESGVTPPVMETKNAHEIIFDYLRNTLNSKVKEEGNRQTTTEADTLTNSGDKTEFETNVRSSVTDEAQTINESLHSTGDDGKKENAHTGDGQITTTKERTSIADKTDIETNTDTPVTGDAETTAQVDTSTDDKADIKASKDNLLTGDEQSTTKGDTYNTTGINTKTFDKSN